MTGASPFESLLVADAGDVYLTMYDLPRAANDIHQQYTKLLSTGCKLLTIGGDHSITYPILKAYRVCIHCVTQNVTRFIFTKTLSGVSQFS